MANDTVSIALKAEGISEVMQQLKSMRQAYLEAEHAATTAAEAGSKKRLDTWKKEQDEHAKMVKKIREGERYNSSFGHGTSGGSSALSSTRAPSGSIDRLTSSLTSGQGLGGVVAAAGAAGVAVGAFMSSIQLATNALKSFSSFVLSDVVKPAWSLETKAQQIVNNSGGAISGKELISTSRAVAIRNNFEASDVASAIDMFGDKQKGMDMIGTVATMAKGRGIPMAELAALVAPLSSKMSAKDMEALLPSLAAQSRTAQKTGGRSIGLGEMASLGEAWIAPSEKLAGDQNTQLREMSGLMQTGAKGFKGTRQTAAGVTGFLTEALGSTALQAKFGKDFAVDKTTGAMQIADPAKLIADIMGATKGGASGLKALGLGEGTSKLLGGAYGETYKNAAAESKAAGANDEGAANAGAAAVEASIKAVVLASGTLKEEEDARAKVMQTSGEKWDAAVARLKDKLLELEPQISEFADELIKDMPGIAKAAVDVGHALIALAEMLKAVAEFFGKTFETPTDKDQKMQFNTETGKLEVVARTGTKDDEELDRDLHGGRLDLDQKALNRMATRGDAEARSNFRMVPSDGAEPIDPMLLHMGRRLDLSIERPGSGAGAPAASGGAAPAPVAPAADELHAALTKTKGSTEALGKTIDSLNLTFGQFGRHKTLLDN